ncbi:site-specific DNA-methyltransferase [Malaciobacter marinus]|jgi:adenine-specific DNA-methyltransferase|uniref:site-specific DNA-methyltransferase n=1 Tax=Malaciobacter marinus TaxID=505249 RepID=UPI0009A6A344|nr:site-specific DNA-methyltransferase [Malaciobacter marinus]SKB29508.1 adenine-specific DNA-methyltransferase [Malaciobacter marinus]
MSFEKLDMKTVDFKNENIAKIAELFPNVVSEDENGKAIDFEALKQELSENIIDGYKERYSLNWAGKREAQLSANTPTTKTLRPCKEESVDFDTTENLYIEGDNLEVLKILQESYMNKIKMIYIDPPYNTGNDFVYKDDFSREIEVELLESGQIDEEGGRLVSNPDSNGRYHSDWLSMMYPRLKLARNLLKEDGVIFISIDDNEVVNLRKICDEIFGENNFEADFHIKVRHENRILREDIRYQLVMEHILCYRKSSYTPNRKEKIKNSSDDYEYDIILTSSPSEIIKIGTYEVEVYDQSSYELKQVEKGKGQFKEYQIRGSLISQKGSASEYYELNLRERKDKDKEGALYKVIGMGLKGDGLGYRYIRQPYDFTYKNGFYYQGKPLRKEDKGLPYENYYDFTSEMNTVGYEGDIDFKNGKKPLGLLNKVFEISNIVNDKDALILDFFSGSATTAHATMKLNSEDNGNRNFIMVQLPEETDEKSEAYKAGYKTIPEIGKERIRRAGKKIVEESGKTDLDIGFRVLKLDSSNMKEVYFNPSEISQQNLFESVDNIKEDRSDLDLLFGVLIDWGVDLTLPITKETIAGKTCYFVDEDSLCACFEDSIDEEFIKELASKDMLRVVFKDSSFGNNDDLKDNVSQIFKQLNPNVDIKVI